MRVWICIVALLILLNAFPVNAADISECIVISSPGYYRLVSDILNSSENVCILIDSDDVVFDGAGYIVDGQSSWGTYGIKISAESGAARLNVTVLNLTLRDWTYGVYAEKLVDGLFKNITAMKNQYGIYLKETDNVTLENVNSSFNGYGVYLYYMSDNNRLLNCSVNENSVRGISIYRSSGNIIEGCRLLKNGNYGIEVRNSENTTIKHTDVNGARYGIYLYYSSNSILENNSANSNIYGIALYHTPNNVLENNTVSLNSQGIRIYYSSGNILRNNSAYNNTYNYWIEGNAVKDFYQDIDTSNLADGKQVYYLTNESDTVISGKDVGFLGVISSRNITIRNLELKNNSHGILFVNTSNSRIENVTLYHNYFGIYALSSNNNSISNSNTSLNFEDGIFLVESNNNSLLNNTIYDNRVKNIHLKASTDNIISNNDIHGDNNGLAVEFGSRRNLISRNNFSGGQSGIRIYQSDKNIIYNNEINICSTSGIKILSSDTTSIKNITIICTGRGTSQIAIYIDGSNNVSMSNIVVSWAQEAFYISNSANVDLTDFDVTVTEIGIVVYRASNVSISKGIMYVSVQQSIKSSFSDNISIKNCTISNSFGEGIFFKNTKNSELVKNKFVSNIYGVRLVYSDDNLIAENIFEFNDYGIYSEFSSNNISNNYFSGNVLFDLYSDDWLSSYGYDNQCNKPDGWNDTGTTGCTYGVCDVNSSFVTITLDRISEKRLKRTENIENIRATFDNATFITKDQVSGWINFTEVNISIISSKTFNPYGFLNGSWMAEINGSRYSGLISGLLLNSSGITLLYGSMRGDISASVHGKVNLSSNNYRFTIQTAKILDSETTLTLHVAGNVTVEENKSKDAELLLKFTRMKGEACGRYTGELNAYATSVEWNGEGMMTVRFSAPGNERALAYAYIKNSSIEVYGSSHGFLSGIIEARIENGRFNGQIWRTDSGLPAMADLEVKIMTPSRMAVGGTYDIIIEYTNSGPIKAENVTLIHKLPPSFKPVFSGNSKWFYRNDVHELFYLIGDLNPRESGSLSSKIKIEYTTGSLFTTDYAFIGTTSPEVDVYLDSNLSVPVGEYMRMSNTQRVEVEELTEGEYNMLVSLEHSLIFHAQLMGYSLIDGIGVKVTYGNRTAYFIPLVKVDDMMFLVKIEGLPGFLMKFNPTSTEIFNHNGGIIFRENGYEVYGDWNVAHSPTTGVCILNCLKEQLSGWALGYLLGKIKDLADFLKDAIDTYGVLTSCYNAYATHNIRDEIKCTRSLTGMFKDIPIPLIDETLDASWCTAECLDDPYSHACEEGDVKSRCSKPGFHIGEDFLSDVIINYDCVDGEWRHTTSYPCYAEGLKCVESPGGKSTARCDNPNSADNPREPDGNMGSADIPIGMPGDPNVKYVDKKAVHPGEYVNFTVEFENIGNGTAFGVYVEDVLDKYLNDSSLIIGDMYNHNGTFIGSGSYDPSTRMITWVVDEVPPKEGGEAIVKIRVRDDITEPVTISNHAVVYFPTVNQITPTNTTYVEVCVAPKRYIYNNTCVNCTSDADCGANEFCNESHWCEKINNPPVARMHVQSTAFVNQNVTFDATKSYDPDGDRITCYWSFGDGNFTVGELVKHVYTSPGTYNVTLGVVDEKGEMDFTSAFIAVVQQNKPVASFTYSPSIPWEGEQVTFNASSSYDTDGSIVSYTWNFGDGYTTTTIELVVVHAYPKVGNYVVNLTVTDNDGLENSTSMSVRVTVMGDFNGNGEVDIGDVTYVAWMLIGKTNTELRADFNGNGRVDIGDLARIAYYVLGRINEY